MTWNPIKLPEFAYLTRLPGNVRGMLWMLVTALGFTGMGASIKVVASELPLATVLLWRMIFTLAALSPWLVRTGPPAVLTARMGTHFLRSVISAASLACYVYALSLLPLADVIAIGYTKPLWVIVIAMVVLGETAGLKRGIATVVGFLGVLIIARPHGEVDVTVLIAFAYALLGAFAMTILKRLSATEPATRMVFYYAFFTLVFSVGPATYDWHLPTLEQFAWLAAAAVSGGIGQYCLGRACAVADTTVVAPMDYVRLPAAAALGYVLFKELPTGWTILGTAVVLAATFTIGRLEAKRRATAPGAAPPSDSSA
jgi:drug/metabolite transporter (DMT)-like permease